MGAALSKHIMVAPDVRRQWARLTWMAMAVVLLLGNMAVRRQYPQLAQLANPQVIQAQQLLSAKRAMAQRRTDDAILSTPLAGKVMVPPCPASAGTMLKSELVARIVPSFGGVGTA